MNAEFESGRSFVQPQRDLARRVFLADVRGTLGPYLNVFLVTQQGWSQSSVGVMTTISGLIGLAAQTPAGAAMPYGQDAASGGHPRIGTNTTVRF